MQKPLRKDWPRIRLVTIKGIPFYRVDGRRKGTNGRQETFKILNEAEDRASELAEHFNLNGVEGLSFPVELRGMALASEKMLAPYGKTVFQAAEFYKAHLDALKEKQESALVRVLAKRWQSEKKSGKHKTLREATLRGIAETAATLESEFGSMRILEVSTDKIKTHLDGMRVGLRRKFNVVSRLSQFFNWAIKNGHAKDNPCAPIEIHVDGKDVSIMTPKEALNLIQMCKSENKDLLLYHAISLFAGLRPDECFGLKWENIHLEEKTITVMAATSKTKETRNVPISSNLSDWLEACPTNERKGYVTPQENFKKRTLALHVALGFKGAAKNDAATPWPQDILRHSYGSYWLAKFRNRAQLAENMGNSLQIIKKHYKRVVSKSACTEYWKITPEYTGEDIQKPEPTAEELKAVRATRLLKALA